MQTPVNLLIADDHTVVTDGLKTLLGQGEEFIIKGIAHDGAEALEMLRALKVDVVLMDIDMPVLNGIDATRRIRKEFPSVRVLILTMHDERPMINLLLEAGAQGYLLKTSSREEIARGIRAVMEGQQFLSEDAYQVLLRQDAPDKSGKLGVLTERETEILRLIAEGYSNKEIGDKLFISHRTVDTHRTNLMQKLDVHNIAGLVRLAIENGLVS